MTMSGMRVPVSRQRPWAGAGSATVRGDRAEERHHGCGTVPLRAAVAKSSGAVEGVGRTGRRVDDRESLVVVPAVPKIVIGEDDEAVELHSLRRFQSIDGNAPVTKFCSSIGFGLPG